MMQTAIKQLVYIVFFRLPEGLKPDADGWIKAADLNRLPDWMRKTITGVRLDKQGYLEGVRFPTMKERREAAEVLMRFMDWTIRPPKEAYNLKVYEKAAALINDTKVVLK